jgi:hypothetical protein
MGDIMPSIKKLRREWKSLWGRRKSLRHRELEGLAGRVGRQRANRGKEPTYERPGWLPLTIPDHPGTLAIGTACNVLDQLEQDIDSLEAECGKREEKEEEEEDDGGRDDE